jgi:nucleotide-binding universal stress UspA family protein
MKKIIIPFDGNHFSRGAFSFAKSLHEIKPVLIAGVFLPTVDYARFFLFPAAFAAPVYIPLMEHFEEENVEENIEQFTQLCQKNFIEYRVHENLYEFSIPQLIKETRFADLMIVGSENFYKSGIGYGSNEYLKDALHDTECPVIIVPERFNFPSQIIFAYDGSASSVFAIKQFAGLFPELCSCKATLVYMGDQKHSIPDQILIEELAARHFKDLTITKLTSGIKEKADIKKWFSLNKDSLVVSGSFGRSGMSELFKRSFIMDLIKEYKTPVFIAHK